MGVEDWTVLETQGSKREQGLHYPGTAHSLKESTCLWPGRVLGSIKCLLQDQKEWELRIFLFKRGK